MPVPSSVKLPDITSPRYVLVGECNRCGKCCELEGEEGKGCEHLSYDEEGLALCAIYDTRMEMCKNYPAAPPIMITECSYRFRDTWDGDKELAPKEI